MNLKLLAEPFAANEIEWRIGQAGVNKQNAVWAKVLAYVTNRAIMERLDAVCGPENWRNEYRYEAGGAVLCGISVRVFIAGNFEWMTKWDGAENTDIEAVKGGLSNAMKRAAVQWGIGRYLYDLEEGWATIGENEQNYAPGKPDNGNKKGYPPFRWSPPKLPAWAQPSAVAEPVAEKAPAKPKLDSMARSIEKAKLVLVREKPLGDYTTDELASMEAKLRAEGQAKHRDLLGSITLILSDRPADDVGVARMNASEHKHQEKLEKVMAGAS